MKTVNLRLVTLLCCLPLLLCHCASTQDVQNLNMRLRTLDNKLVEMEKDVVLVQNTAGTSVDRVQRQQAGLGDSVDSLQTELLQVKGQLDESRHRSRNLQEANTELLAEIDRRMLGLTATVADLSERLARLESDVSGIRAARTREATARAEAAAREAKRAREKAKKKMEQARSTRSIKSTRSTRSTGDQIHEIVPAKAKIKGRRVATSTVARTSEPVRVHKTAKIEKASGPGKEIYDEALSLFKAKKYQKSYDLFSTYIEKYPSGKLTVNARFWAADCLFKQKEYALSILEYQNVIADHPRHAKAPAALLKQGLAFEALEDNDTAKIVYKKILSDYSTSDQAATARKKLDKLGK